ncbi:MAG: hypothetical protein K2W99_03870, partial [Chthoniobacterales bacterium]|nr:hypothetical protein [Chthoniobacterales bacterium]
MKNLSLLLLLSWFMLGPLPVSAMMERKADPKEEESKNQETLKCSKREEERALIQNVGASYMPSFGKKILFKQAGDGLNQEKISPTPGGAEASNGGNNGEEEDLSDLTTLEQKIQEAQEVINDLGGKGTPISEQELGNLNQTWSQRYQRYQEAQSSLLKNNNFEPIKGEQNQLKLEKLGELVGISQEIIIMLEGAEKALATFSNTTRIEEFSYSIQNQQHNKMNITKPSLSGTPYHYVTENENNTTAA